MSTVASPFTTWEAHGDRDGRDPPPDYYEEVGCPQGTPVKPWGSTVWGARRTGCGWGG